VHPQDRQPEQPQRRAWPPAPPGPPPSAGQPGNEPSPGTSGTAPPPPAAAAVPVEAAPPAPTAESPAPQVTERPETAEPAEADQWSAGAVPADGIGQPAVPEQPDGTVPPGGEATPPPKRRRIPWKRLAVIGVVLVTLGVFTVGVATGWALGSRSAGASGDTTTEIIAAPTDAAGGVPVLPDVRGLLLVDAQQAVIDAGLPLDVVQTVDAPSALAAGTVLRQDPVGGTSKVSTVTLYVSVPGAVPDLVGRTADEARAELLALGVEFEQEQVFDPGAAEGTVLALNPPPGSSLASAITVTVAGPAASIFLADLDPIEGGCSTDDTSINGTDFANSLLCSASSYENTSTYLVDRVTTSLDMTVGISDDSDTDVRVRMVVVADGRPVAAVDAGYGQSQDISVPTTGVLRLEIRYTASGQGSGRLALGNARLTGSPEGITSLDTE
jgi:hypothetical protein